MEVGRGDLARGLLVIWLAFVLLGVVIKGLLWLAILRALLFVVAAVVCYVKREVLKER